ncbi:MAG: hypothetical protein CVU90_02045 [Firmicutes bacterium HGW-Firmicutes-15]|nr:MAG: hypothetical protein CVU90_02045 [Firmicutes bacterium HGW-Firmicutes-15]
MSYMIFNNKSSTDVDLGIVSITRVDIELLPETKDMLLSIPGRNGAYDFGSTYEPRKITVTFMVKQKLQSYVTAIAAWLSTTTVKTLSFSDNPSKVYMARPTGAVIPTSMGSLLIYDVTFIVPSEV